MKAPILALGLALALPCAAEPWTREEWLAQGAYTVLHVADWQQTRTIARSAASGGPWIERNPVLGPRPSQAQVNRYMATTLVAHWAVAYALPPEWRREWQRGTIALELGVVRGNYKLGIGVGF